MRSRVNPVPFWQRILLAGALGCALLSGSAWLLLQRFRPLTEGLDLPSPWEPVLMRAHAFSAWVFLFALGGFTASHVGRGWRTGSRRGSGVSMLLLALACAGSGFAMAYLLQPQARAATGVVHAGLGVGLSGWSLWHRRRRSR